MSEEATHVLASAEVARLDAEREKAQADAQRQAEQAGPAAPAAPAPEGAKRVDAVVEVHVDPKAVEVGVAFLSKVITGRAGVAPLTPDEIREGGEALAPVIQRYAPLFIQRTTAHPELAVAFAWLAGVVVIRALPLMADEKPAAPEAGQGRAPTGAPGKN